MAYEHVVQDLKDDVDAEKQNANFDSARKSRMLTFTQALTIVFLIIQFIFIIRFWSMTPICARKSASRGADIIEARWHRDTAYMSLDHVYDHLWNETGQSALIFDEDKHVVQITMFHQLHCLAAIRKGLQDAREGKEIGLDQRDNTHWPHCLHFLRQAVICAADGTFERAGTWPNGTAQTFINGYGDLRYCRSSKELYELRSVKKLY